MEPAPDRSLLSTGLSDGLGVATAVAGAGDWIKAGRMAAAGSSNLSSGLSVLTGLNTMLTHDPHAQGEGAAATESVAMGMTDAVFGMGGGLAAVADSALGGNLSGLLKAGVGFVSSAADAGQTGNLDAVHHYGNAVVGGEYGAAAGGVGVLGDALGQGAGMLYNELFGDYETPDFDTSAMESFSAALLGGSELNPMTWVARGGLAAGDLVGDAIFGD